MEAWISSPSWFWQCNEKISSDMSHREHFRPLYNCLRCDQESVTLPSPFDKTCRMYSSDDVRSCQKRQNRNKQTAKDAVILFPAHCSALEQQTLLMIEFNQHVKEFYPLSCNCRGDKMRSRMWNWKGSKQIRQIGGDKILPKWGFCGAEVERVSIPSSRESWRGVAEVSFSSQNLWLFGGEQNWVNLLDSYFCAKKFLMLDHP